MGSFGALLGKTTPAQLTLLLLLEVPIYAVNAHWVADTFKVGQRFSSPHQLRFLHLAPFQACYFHV